MKLSGCATLLHIRRAQPLAAPIMFATGHMLAHNWSSAISKGNILCPTTVFQAGILGEPALTSDAQYFHQKLTGSKRE